jgi:hypothetical protein
VVIEKNGIGSGSQPARTEQYIRAGNLVQMEITRKTAFWAVMIPGSAFWKFASQNS